jgi:hypothetical protein
MKVKVVVVVDVVEEAVEVEEVVLQVLLITH